MKDKKDEVNKILAELNKKYLGRNIFLFVMGMVVSAFAFNLFYEPFDVIPTGSSGLAMLLAKVVNMDVTTMVFIVSMVLTVLGFLFFGWDYGFKMLLVTVLYPSFLKASTLITNSIDLSNVSVTLIMVLGGAAMGLSSGLIRKSGYSPGGFCVLFDIMNKYLYISIGVATLAVNLTVIVLSGFTFGLLSVIYAIVSLIASSYIVDKVVMGISKNKVFYIVTDKIDEVRNVIINKLNYSVTVVNAKGGYTKEKRKMLMSVVPTIEYVKLKEMVGEIDSKAFFLIVDVYETSIKDNCKNL